MANNEIIGLECKMLPQNIEAEEAVLGACLLERNVILEIIDVLTPEMFYKNANMIIFQRLCEMVKNGVEIDQLTAVNYLREKNELDIVGGVYYIASLTNHVVSSANIEQYAAFVRENWMKRSFITFGNELMKRGYDDTFEVNDIISYSDKSILNISNYYFGKKRTEHISVYANEAAEETYNKQKANKEGLPCGIPTGIRNFDLGLNGGWYTGLHIVAARPGMGKTSLMLYFAKTAEFHGFKPLIFSLEMTAKQLSHRFILSELHDSVDVTKYKNGWISDADMTEVGNATAKVKNYEMYIDENCGIDCSYIKSVSFKKKKQGLCDIIFIDYLQLMNIVQEKGQTRDMAIGMVTRQLKDISKELDVPIITLSQLNRSVEIRADKRPQLSDLRESGNIEQDSDTVSFIYRGEYYDATAEKGCGSIIRAKNRNGSLGDSIFYYNESLTKIYDYQISTNNAYYPDQTFDRTPIDRYEKTEVPF